MLERVFFIMQTYRFFLFRYVLCFFSTVSLNMGEAEGYVKLTAMEIAVKRSLHFSFSQQFLSSVLPLLLAFSRHLDFQKTFY